VTSITHERIVQNDLCFDELPSFFKDADVIMIKLLYVFRITQPGLTVEATIVKKLVGEFCFSLFT